jgi:putative oxidoreductase
MKSFATVLGRAALALIFLFAGVSKLGALAGTAAFMGAKGMPFPGFFLAGAIAVEVLGGLSLLLGYRARAGALALALFLVPATLIFHAFWGIPAAEVQVQQIMFMKNLAIIGALLFVAANGAGPASIDARQARLAAA